jgi:xylulokinase
MSAASSALLLGIDLGTTAVKSAVYDQVGGLVGIGSQEYDLLTGPNGVVEVAVDTVWHALVSSVHAALAVPAVAPEHITALALSCQGETQLSLGTDDEPLGNAIVWLDSRAATEAEELAAAFDV